MLDTSYPTDIIWGLFTQKTGADIVKMAIWHRSSGGNHKINPEKAYICERDKAPYSDTFSEYFEPRNPNRSRIQHYLLAGARTEPPLGLIRKFFYESVMQSLDRQFYYYSFMDRSTSSKKPIRNPPGGFLPAPLQFSTKTVSSATDLFYTYDALGHLTTGTNSEFVQRHCFFGRTSPFLLCHKTNLPISCAQLSTSFIRPAATY